MGGGMGSFVEGLAGGIQQGQKLRMAAELQDMQMKHLKTTNKAAEIALKMEQAKGGIFDTLTPEERKTVLFPKADESLEGMLNTINKMRSGQATPTPAVPLPDYEPGQGMPPFRPGATMSVPQTIAQGQVGGDSFFGLTQDDLIRGVIKKKLGAEPMKYSRTAQVIMSDGNPGTAPIREDGLIDISKAVPAPYKLDTQKGVGDRMAPTETPVNPYTRLAAGKTVQTGPPPTMQGQAATTGGGATPYAIPIFGGAGGIGTPGVTGGVRTKLDMADTPVDENAARMYRMKDGSMPKVGIDTPNKIMAAGGKLISSKMIDIEGPTKVVTELVDQLDAYAFGPGGIFTGIKPGLFNRGAQGASDKVSSFMQTTGRGEKIALYESYKQAFAGSLARTVMFEVGVMTDQDIARAVKAVPVILPIPDTEIVAKAKLKLIRGFIGKLSSVTDRKGMESALSSLEAAVKTAEKAGKPDLSLGKDNVVNTWESYKKQAAGGR